MLDWHAAGWLPVYLVGMGVIVYLSAFGGLKSPLYGVWWSIAIVAAFH